MTDAPKPPQPANPGATATTSRYRAVKAYRNEQFLNSRDARALRILSEYLEPAGRFDKLGVRDTIVFFGSARIPSAEKAQAALAAARADGGDVAAAERQVVMARYYEAARALAHRLTTWSKGLEGQDRRFVVCTGGGPGIMEAANRGASEAKGVNVGLGISLPDVEPPNQYVTRSLAFEFHYFFMRKFWFLYLAKAIVVMPGGFGTMDEFFEVITLIQTFKITKCMPMVLFGESFWDDVVDFEALVRWGTIGRDDLKLFLRTDSVDEAYAFLTTELVAHGLDLPGPSL
ncbi:MAG: LOG family protein [Alphaproteobacteria bacterium]|nr:LOG family protein [Alphaproteobacteria bacterium]